jgi:hypothetical protein
MDQRSDHIREDIESTRASLDEKLDSLETKARQAFDLNHQVAERPWMALGAAVAAGYVLGSLTGGDDNEQRWQGQPATTTDYNQHASTAQHPSSGSGSSVGDTLRSTADSIMSQFDDEIDMLKSAAIATLTTFLRDAVKEYVPAMGQQLDQTLRKRGIDTSNASGTSAASGASKYYDVRESSTSVNHEAIPQTTSQHSNMADHNAEHATPYYPPGSTGTSGERERSIGGDNTRY